MNNPPAFPNDVKPINERVGMTLRDYFAAKAIIAYHSDGSYSAPKDVANWCYEIADAMMKAREA